MVQHAMEQMIPELDDFAEKRLFKDVRAKRRSQFDCSLLF